MATKRELLLAKYILKRLLFRKIKEQVGLGVNINKKKVVIYLNQHKSHIEQKILDIIKEIKPEGYDIDFMSVGDIKPLVYQCSDFTRTTYQRPVNGGVSIGYQSPIAGTMGVVCYDAVTKEKMFLSNNHVLSRSSSYQNPYAKIGDPIYAPGCLDTYGKCTYNMGILDRYILFDEQSTNFVDGAVGKPNNPEEISDYIEGIGKLTGHTNPEEGLHVKKSGRSSCVTEGTILDYNAAIDVDYGGGRLIHFENCIVTTPMGISGDSGSVLVDDSNRAVGLLFAGSDQITVFNRIDYVMDELNILMTPSDSAPIPDYVLDGSEATYNILSTGLVVLSIAGIAGISGVIANTLKH